MTKSKGVNRLVQTDWLPGTIGDLARCNLENRLRTFIVDHESEPLVLFTPEGRVRSLSGDWYGEHLGKWMVSAAHACARTGDERLIEQVALVTDSAIRYQEDSGYFGTYAAESEARMTSSAASARRTWDLWTHAWALLGLIAVSDSTATERALSAADRIGRLLLKVFPEVHLSPLDLGNHAGLSSSVLIGPLAKLAERTGDQRYADLALDILSEAERRGIPLLTFDPTRNDAAQIGTGKAYQILWTAVGMLQLYGVKGEERLLTSVKGLWQNVRDHHLTPTGGPWGGVATHKEVFNEQGFFSPYGLVETCSTATWMALNQELFAITGDDRTVEAYETSVLNALLGAVNESATEWSYFTSPNGRRLATYAWACCRSSGAMAVEAASDMIVSLNGEAVDINLYMPSRCSVPDLVVTQEGDLGALGSIQVRIEGQGTRDVRLRVPEWSEDFMVRRDGVEFRGRYGQRVVLERCRGGETIVVTCRRPLRVQERAYTLDHHGQEIVRMEYACLTRGPFVYSTGLRDGYKFEETVCIPRLTPDAVFRALDEQTVEFNETGRRPLTFQPYYLTPSRNEGGWRTTWLQVAWQ